MPSPFHGDRLKALRTEAGWSQAELAAKIDSDARQVSRYENNKVAPGLEAVIRIAQVLNTSVDYLLFDDAQRRPSTRPAASSTPDSPTSTSSPTTNAPPSPTSSTHW
jgi:transcriptional regulator with XRE-family HTH domain